MLATVTVPSFTDLDYVLPQRWDTNPKKLSGVPVFATLCFQTACFPQIRSSKHSLSLGLPNELECLEVSLLAFGSILTYDITWTTSTCHGFILLCVLLTSLMTV
eukprot:scpid110459/ scgid24924/ 